MFQFTIREGLLVMLVCAVIGAWWSDHWMMAGSLASSEREREKFELMANILLTLRHPPQGEMCNPPMICGTFSQR